MKSPGPSYTGTLVSSSKSSKDISMTRDGVADVRGRWNRAHRMATIASAVRRRISATSVPPGGTRRFKNTGTFGPPPLRTKNQKRLGNVRIVRKEAGCQVGEVSSSSGAGRGGVRGDGVAADGTEYADYDCPFGGSSLGSGLRPIGPGRRGRHGRAFAENAKNTAELSSCAGTLRCSKPSQGSHAPEMHGKPQPYPYPYPARAHVVFSRQLCAFLLFFFFGQQECLGTSYVVCGACRGRGKVGGLLDTSESKGERCETCDGEGILACQECNATGIKNNWLFQPAKDPGWGPRGEP